MYKSLQTNIPKEIMALPEMPFPTQLPSFVPRREALAYIEKFAEVVHATEFVRLNTLVESITPVDEGVGWKVASRCLSAGSESSVQQTEDFDFVVVANGHYSQAFTPEIRGMHHFQGSCTHSSTYRFPEPFADKNVVVVGDGPSALDVASEVATTARAVTVSMRPTADRRFINSLKTGNVQDVGEISHCSDEGDLVLASGECLSEQDAVIFCTGYDFSFPFLDESLVSVKDNMVAPLYQHLFHNLCPSLAFMTVPLRVDPWPLADVQSRTLGRVWTGQAVLPDREARVARHEELVQQCQAQGLPLHHVHLMSSKQWAYMHSLMETQWGAQWRSKQPEMATRLDTLQAVYEEVTRSRNVRYSTYRSRFYHVPPHLLHSSGTLPKGRALDGSDLVDVCPACEGDLGGYDGAVYPPAADGTQDASGFHYHERL